MKNDDLTAFHMKYRSKGLSLVLSNLTLKGPRVECQADKACKKIFSYIFVTLLSAYIAPPKAPSFFWHGHLVTL